MRRLYRSDKDKMIAGVCGGISETYNLDPSVVRIVTVLVAIFTAIMPMIIAYIAAWIIIPKKEAITNP